MNSWNLWGPETAELIFLALLHVLWQGTVLAVLVALVLWLTRITSANVRYHVYSLALLLTAVCLPLNVWVLASQPVAAESIAASDAALATSPHADWQTQTSVRAPVASGAIDVGSFAARSHSHPSDPAHAAAESTAVCPFSKIGTTAQSGIASFKSLAPWIVPLYLIGILAMAGRLLMGVYGGQRIRTRSVRIENGVVYDALPALARRMKLRFVPELRATLCATTPIVVGILKPAILIPMAMLSELSPAQVEALLLHELAHLRRYDHLWNLLHRTAEVLLFFHPAVWWLSHKIAVEREHCCDDLAVLFGSDRCDYAESLVKVSELRNELSGMSGGLAVLAFAGGRRTNLATRVRRIISGSHDRPNPGLSRLGILVFMALFATAMLPAVSWRSGLSQAQEPAQDAAAEDQPEKGNPAQAKEEYDAAQDKRFMIPDDATVEQLNEFIDSMQKIRDGIVIGGSRKSDRMNTWVYTLEAANRLVRLAETEEALIEATMLKFDTFTYVANFNRARRREYFAWAESIEDLVKKMSDDDQRLMLSRHAFVINFAPEKYVNKRIEEIGDYVEQYGMDKTASDLVFQYTNTLEYNRNPKYAARLNEKVADTLSRRSGNPNSAMIKRMRADARRQDIVGKPLDLVGKNLDGKDFDWSSYRGKSVFVYYWTSRSSRCRNGLRYIKTLIDKRPGIPFEVVGVCLDDSEKPCRDFVEKYKLPWVTLFPGEGERTGYDSELGRKFNLAANSPQDVPFTVFVNPDGVATASQMSTRKLRYKLAELYGPVEKQTEEQQKLAEAGKIMHGKWKFFKGVRCGVETPVDELPVILNVDGDSIEFEGMRVMNYSLVSKDGLFFKMDFGRAKALCKVEDDVISIAYYFSGYPESVESTTQNRYYAYKAKRVE